MQALHLLLEQALKNVTLDGYASFLATFFVQFMPVASLAVREFDAEKVAARILRDMHVPAGA